MLCRVSIVVKSCRMQLETRDRHRVALTTGSILFLWISYGRKGKEPGAGPARFHWTPEFFLQTFEYRSESCYVSSRPPPAWMYAVSMLTEQITSFVQFGKRSTRFSRDLELWQEGNKIPCCTMRCQGCPHWTPVSAAPAPLGQHLLLIMKHELL